MDGQREFAFFYDGTRIEQYATPRTSIAVRNNHLIGRFFSRKVVQSTGERIRIFVFLHVVVRREMRTKKSERSHIKFYLLICIYSLMKHKFSSKVEHFSSSRSYEKDGHVSTRGVEWRCPMARDQILSDPRQWSLPSSDPLSDCSAFARRLLPSRNVFLLQPSYAQQQTCPSWPC